MIVRLVTRTGGVSRAADASARAVGLGCGLGKIEVIMLYCLGAFICALCVFGTMHVLIHQLK